MEQFTNLATTTLANTITAGATTLQVTDSTNFPESGDFRLNIQDELLLVTAVAGTTFTVTRAVEGTTAASHAAGATVAQVLTVASLENLVAQETGISGLTAGSVPYVGAGGTLTQDNANLFWDGNKHQLTLTKDAIESSSLILKSTTSTGTAIQWTHDNGGVATQSARISGTAGASPANGLVSISVNDGGTLTQRATLDHTGLLSTVSLVLGGDTNLYRSAANVLKTDDAFVVGGSHSVLSSLIYQEASVSDGAVAVQIVNNAAESNSTAEITLVTQGANWYLRNKRSAGLFSIGDGTSDWFSIERFTGLVGINKASSIGAQFHAVARTATTVGLRIDSAATPSMDMVQVKINAGNEGVYISSAGTLQAKDSGGNIRASITTKGTLTAHSTFSSYIPDGVFGAAAIPSRVTTLSEAELRFGYIDFGAAHYFPSIGFALPSAHIGATESLKILQSRFATGASPESFNRWDVSYTGRMQWGSGSATPDTNLYRSAANVLKTDDDLQVVGNVGIGSGAGTSGRSIVWAGGDGASHYASIGTAFSSAAVGLLAGLKQDPVNDQYLESFSWSSMGVSGIRLGSFGSGNAGIVRFFGSPLAARTAGAVFDHAANEYLSLETNQTVFNQPGRDVDFRIESDTIQHAFFIDGGTGLSGFNKNVPAAQVHTVARNATTVGLRVDSAASPATDLVQVTENGTNRLVVNSVGILKSIGTTSGQIEVDTSGTNQTLALAFRQSGTLMGRIQHAGSNSPGSRYLGIQLDDNTTALDYFAIFTKDASNVATERLKIGHKADIADFVITTCAVAIGSGSSVTISGGVNFAFGTSGGSKLGTTALQKIGFWDATPIVQPAANADTSGATLTELETEVNELKQLLRNVGFMAT